MELELSSLQYGKKRLLLIVELDTLTIFTCNNRRIEKNKSI